jgi:hypothetical protein
MDQRIGWQTRARTFADSAKKSRKISAASFGKEAMKNHPKNLLDTKIHWSCVKQIIGSWHPKQTKFFRFFAPPPAEFSIVPIAVGSETVPVAARAIKMTIDSSDCIRLPLRDRKRGTKVHNKKAATVTLKAQKLRHARVTLDTRFVPNACVKDVTVLRNPYLHCLQSNH